LEILSRLFFLDAPGGTKKTFTINAITAAAKILIETPIICAKSDVAHNY